MYASPAFRWGMQQSLPGVRTGAKAHHVVGYHGQTGAPATRMQSLVVTTYVQANGILGLHAEWSYSLRVCPLPEMIPCFPLNPSNPINPRSDQIQNRSDQAPTLIATEVLPQKPWYTTLLAPCASSLLIGMQRSPGIGSSGGSCSSASRQLPPASKQLPPAFGRLPFGGSSGTESTDVS